MVQYQVGGEAMRKLDEIVYFACLIVTLVLGFAGGVLTTMLTILILIGRI